MVRPRAGMSGPRAGLPVRPGANVNANAGAGGNGAGAGAGAGGGGGGEEGGLPY